MPCDPIPIPYDSRTKGPDRIITPDGQVLSGIYLREDSKNMTGLGFRPHWATCPGTIK